MRRSGAKEGSSTSKCAPKNSWRNAKSASVDESSGVSNTARCGACRYCCIFYGYSETVYSPQFIAHGHSVSCSIKMSHTRASSAD